MRKIEYYRKRAAALRREALTERDPDAKLAKLETALALEQLASRILRSRSSSNPSSSRAGTDRPKTAP
jgi:hypothetical protein